MCRSARVVEVRRLALEARRVGRLSSGVSRRPRLLEQPCPNEGVLRKPRGLLEVPLSFLASRQGGGSFSGERQLLGSPRPEQSGVVRFRSGLVCVEVMRRDDLDEFGLHRCRRPFEICSGGDVADLSLRLRERVVGDALEQVLEKRVLASLGRARVGLHGQDLLAQQGSEQRLERLLAEPRERGQAGLREALA